MYTLKKRSASPKNIYKQFFLFFFLKYLQQENNSEHKSFLGFEFGEGRGIDELTSHAYCHVELGLGASGVEELLQVELVLERQTCR